MPSSTQTINMTTSDQPRTLGTVTQLDASGNPLPKPDTSYGAPTVTVADPTIVILSEIPNNPVTIAPGQIGTTTVTVEEVSTDPAKEPITNVATVNNSGPVAAGLDAPWNLPS